LDMRIRQKLFEVEDDEIGRHLSSDDDDPDVNDQESVFDEEDHLPISSSKKHFLDLDALMERSFIDHQENASTTLLTDEIDVIEDGLRWKLGGTVDGPQNVSKNERSRLKVGAARYFTTPWNSFMAFIPLDFWKLWVYETNRYGFQKESLKGSFRPISTPEFINFFGILLAMTLQPMPGRRYTRAWDEPNIHPYTQKMNKYRFTQIRSLLHMVNNNDASSAKKDSLYKVRPLLNVLKKGLGQFIEVGSELSLDESSIPCRSAYGRSLIYYNPTKPTGKYHFRFYLLCETDYYNCVRFRMQTRDSSDVGDGLNAREEPPCNDDGAIVDERKKETTVIEKLVLDMCSPLFYTGRVVNTDNYYTSPLVFVELFKKGVFARGTCRGNRTAFPKIIQLSSSEANKGKRGDLHIATSQDPPMVAFSWLDGNPVNFLTTADGSEMSEVKRRVSRQKQAVSAPACVGRYNKNMQAVDRFDQLNQLFSLAKRHKFKKYYNQLTMALLDMALVNAEQHFFMVDGRKKTDESRYEFRKVLSQSFLEYTSELNELNDDFGLNKLFVSTQEVTMHITDNDDNPGRVVLGKQQDDGFLLAPNTEAPTPSIAASTTRCQPISVMAYMKRKNSNLSGGRSYRGSRCQVCAWEMRSNVTKNVALCSEHGIRMCTVLRPLSAESPFAKALLDEEKKKMLDEWYCKDQTITCWRKGHEFYIPRGIWGKGPRLRYDSHGCPKTICAAIGCCAYKKRSEWEVSEGLKNSTPKSRGRKRKHKKLPDMDQIDDDGVQVNLDYDDLDELEDVVATEKV
jgi:hypothetical protein